MSGVPLHSPLHAAWSGSTAALPPDAGGSGRRARATPALSILLSGGFHFVALVLFLFASARAVREEIRTMDMHVRPLPPFRLPPVENWEAAPPAGRPSGPGTIVPVKQEPKFDMKLPPIDPGASLVRDDGNRREPSPPDGGEARLPGIAPPRPNPDVPSEHDVAPVPIYAPEPKYPPIAQDAGIEGLVVVDALVTSEGAVRAVRVKEGNVILAAAAREAVKAWKFRPGKWNGYPVTTWVSVPVRFILR